MAVEQILCPNCEDNTHQVAVDGEIVKIKNKKSYLAQTGVAKKSEDTVHCDCGEAFYIQYK